MTISELRQIQGFQRIFMKPRRLKTGLTVLILVSVIIIVCIYELEVIQSIISNKYRIKTKDTYDALVLETKQPRNKERLVSGAINETFIKYERIFHMPNVSCANIFTGAKYDIEKGIQQAKTLKNSVQLLSDQFYIKETMKDCQEFLVLRGYITDFLTEEERKFPIAYSLIVFKDAEMVDRLLRAIYRPQNFYCIHIDSKSDKLFVKALTGIAQCLPNVFVASRRVDVIWGQFSILEPELICMQELWSKSKTWKYFINLTGQEFPLKTNAELVQILKAYDGANDIEGTIERANRDRWKKQPPNGIRAVKGSVHICVNRKFIDYILHNKTAELLLNWVKTTVIPDEVFFATLNHNPQLGIPGSYKGLPETDNSTRKPFLTRYKNWGGYPFNYSCAGYWTRGICILSTGDLPLLGTRPEMFANKFHLTEDRVVVGCLEERHFNNTRDEYFMRKSFNVSYYKSLDFVKNKIPVWTSEDDRNIASLNL